MIRCKSKDKSIIISRRICQRKVPCIFFSSAKSNTEYVSVIKYCLYFSDKTDVTYDLFQHCNLISHILRTTRADLLILLSFDELNASAWKTKGQLLNGQNRRIILFCVLPCLYLNILFISQFYLPVRIMCILAKTLRHSRLKNERCQIGIVHVFVRFPLFTAIYHYSKQRSPPAKINTRLQQITKRDQHRQQALQRNSTCTSTCTFDVFVHKVSVTIPMLIFFLGRSRLQIRNQFTASITFMNHFKIKKYIF